MESIHFEVSAKMARLIGRENISDVESAIIELVKNSYDADATCVVLEFNVPFPDVPRTISYELAQAALTQNQRRQLLDYYDEGKDSFTKKDDLSEEDEAALAELLFAINEILVIDNGHGMTEKILKTAWMNIGTKDKEENRISPKGRIKTGAKGIGRFALDKLSANTVVCTKNETGDLLKWKMDWNQFENVDLLHEVKATIERYKGSFKDVAQRVLGDPALLKDKYDWKTGTIISLSPMREPWSEALFEKLVNNLKTIFPDSNDSNFDIYMANTFYPEYSLKNDRILLAGSDYDYKIEAEFDGIDSLKIILNRNEINTRKRVVKLKSRLTIKPYDVQASSFWERDAFADAEHARSSYSKAITKDYSIRKLLGFTKAKSQEVGPFTMELFFVKNGPSDVGIVKPIEKTNRNKLLKAFSGIKLYRDGFKVRPYGEEGSEFDWLDLAERAQKNPAAPSHPTSSWRVRSNQILGAVRISLEDNPNLKDMANRQGLAMNDAFSNFKQIIMKVIETFEADRQYPLREYRAWTHQELKARSKTNDALERARREKADKNKQDAGASIAYSAANEIEPKPILGENAASSPSYADALLELDESITQNQRNMQTMMLFSSAGVMLNTFAHELNWIKSEAGSRMQHMREAIKRMVGEEGYQGDPDFDPFELIDEAEDTDAVLENWLDTIMRGVESKSFESKAMQPHDAIAQILQVWEPLLNMKRIDIECDVSGSVNRSVNATEADFYIILNNFLLNSAWFLSQTDAAKKKVAISVQETEKEIVIELSNNGPKLDSQFENNPEAIFEAGVSTKKVNGKPGTGLGMWITRTVVEKLSGQVNIMKDIDGFGIRIVFRAGADG